MVHQLLVKRPERFGRIEHQISRIFGLIGDPIMGHSLENISQERIDETSVFFQDFRPVHLGDAVSEALNTLELSRINMMKGVVDLTVLNIVLVHFSGENIVSVDAYLYGHRE